MNWKAVAAIIFSTVTTALYAQTTGTVLTDSTAIKMTTRAFALAFKNTDSALLLSNEALKLSKETKNLQGEANAYNSIGWCYMHKGNLDSAVIFLQRAWQLFSENKNEYDVVRVDINLAEVYTKQNQIVNAIQYLLQGDSLSAKINSVPLQTDIKRQLAIVYRESGDHKKSAEYFNQALAGFSKQGDFFRYVNTGVSLSILYRQMNLANSSLSLLFRCLQIAKEQKGPPYQVAMTEENIAETYFTQKKYTKALQYYTSAYSTFEKINNQADLAYEAFCIGKTFAKLNQYANAEKFLLQSYRINDSLKLVNYQKEASDELALLYKDAGQWQKAYQYLQKAAEFKDSLNTTAQIEKTNELKEKFETKKKEQEIKLLKTEKQLTEIDNRQTRLLQYIFLLLFTASVVIGWLLFNRFKIKRRLQEQLLRNQIASDLHDDIGSALSSIDIGSRIALVKKEDMVAVEEQLVKIRRQAQKTMDSMSDIVWSINSYYDNFESILSRMREFAAEISEPQQINLQFDVAKEMEALSIDTDKRKNIFLIFKEAVNNAVKYSGCNLLVIQFEKNNAAGFIMRVKDNGNGFDEAVVKNGNGLRNMKMRAAHIGGQLHVQSQRGEGATVELCCHL
jgi:two-component system, NarL family, sensor histidine kinase UhpB